jgi:hypothetical protein
LVRLLESTVSGLEILGIKDISHHGESRSAQVWAPSWRILRYFALQQDSKLRAELRQPIAANSDSQLSSHLHWQELMVSYSELAEWSATGFASIQHYHTLS